MITAAPPTLRDVRCPTCGRLLFRVRGGTLVSESADGRITWADPIEVEINCRLCGNIIATGNDRPQRVLKRAR